MNRLHKAFKKILKAKEMITLDEIYQAMPDEAAHELTRADLGPALEAYLLQAGETQLVVSRPQERVLSRAALFGDCAFRIQLTPDELAERHLIIGHRFLPFIHPATPVESLHFYDEKDRPLPVTRLALPINPSTGIFFNLLPPYGITQYIEGDGTDPQLNMAIIDLQAWIAEHSFGLEDQIRVSVRDYGRSEFYLEKMDSREIAGRRLADRYYDQQLTEAIYEVFDLAGRSFLPVDMHLFWAFAQLDPQLLTQAGTPFGPFISRHENLTFFQDGPYAFLQDKDFMQELMETALEQARNVPPEQMGTATGLNGIFQELGNSFSKLLLRACMIEHLQDKGQIDEDMLREQIFGEQIPAFFNARQQRNFEKAFSKLIRSVEEQWMDRELALPHLQLLRKAIHFKLDIIALLRELNQVEEPEQLNVQALLQLQPIDQSLDQVLENLLSDKPMPYQEAQTLVRQLEVGREKFMLFRDDLLGY